MTSRSSVMPNGINHLPFLLVLKANFNSQRTQKGFTLQWVLRICCEISQGDHFHMQMLVPMCEHRYAISSPWYRNVML